MGTRRTPDSGDNPTDEPVLTAEEEAELVERINGSYYLQPNPAPLPAEVGELVERLKRMENDFHMPPSHQSMRNINAQELAGEALTLLQSLSTQLAAAEAKAQEMAGEIERLTAREDGQSILFARPVGRDIEEWRENVRKTDLYRRGDTILVWVNEGDTCLPPFKQAALTAPPASVESDWIKHDGGDCPVDRNTEVEARTLSGAVVRNVAYGLRWKDDGARVVAYRPASVGEGK